MTGVFFVFIFFSAVDERNNAHTHPDRDLVITPTPTPAAPEV